MIEFKTISDRYTCVFDLISDFAPEFLAVLDPAAKHYLQGFDDYESFAYTVVNDEIVVCSDSINGDVFNTETLPEFLKNTIEYLAENADMWRE